jgi:hypothetical protein
MIRFADVLLWAAEAEIEIGSLDKAEEYVNQVRARSANPDNWVKKYMDDNNPLAGFSDVPAANYKVGLYTGQFAANGKEYAHEAVRMERRLELSLEHHRYHDLQRYDRMEAGYMAKTLNDYLDWRAMIPGVVINYVDPYRFVPGKHEYWPIPQEQIDLSVVEGEATLTQNPGY